MSRIGKMAIELPEGVTAEINGTIVVIKGPKGELKQELLDVVTVKLEKNALTFSVDESAKNASAFWGLSRALVANMVEGVTKGFEKRLELVGVGYRATQKGKGVSLAVGYSHPVEFDPVEGVEVKVKDNKNLIISGIDKQKVGLVAAQIRQVRKPEPYKGKGIRYQGEVVKRKAGKAAKI